MGGTFGILTSHPDLLGCQLLRLDAQVQLGTSTHSTTLVGLGSISAGETLLRRWSTQVAPRRLADPELGASASALLYRGQTFGPGASLEDVQPLRHGSWLFSCEGDLEAFPRVQAWLDAELPPHLVRSVGTGSVASASFALFLAALPQPDQNRPLAARDGARMLGQVARVLAQRSAAEGAARAARLLLMATDGRVLLAARTGDLPAQMRLLEGEARCRRCAVDENSKSRSLVRAHLRSRSVVVTSVPLGAGAHWLPIPDGGSLGVGPSLEPELLNGSPSAG
jgi:glutamine amidotransferase